MRLTGLEPALQLEIEPKSIAYASFATGAYLIFTAKFILPTVTVRADFIFQRSNANEILRVCQFHHTRIKKTVKLRSFGRKAASIC